MINIPLEDPQDFAFFIYGTSDSETQTSDTFSLALNRYLREAKIKSNMLSKMTGIAKSSISRYLSGKRSITPDYLSAICIAIRLHPARQRHLFALMEYSMPGENDFIKPKAYIVRSYLDGCAYNCKYSLISCNQRLCSIHEKPLTKLLCEDIGL